MYIVTVTSDKTSTRTYNQISRSALEAANRFGRCERGEVINIYRPKSGKLIAQARWTPENGGYYYNCYING